MRRKGREGEKGETTVKRNIRNQQEIRRLREEVFPGTCRGTRMNVCDLHRCLDCPLLLPAFCHVESQQEKPYYIP